MVISSTICRYTTAISQLSRAMTNVQHQLKAPATAEAAPPPVKTWTEEDETQFILRPRREVPEQSGNRGSSSSWYLA